MTNSSELANRNTKGDELINDTRANILRMDRPIIRPLKGNKALKDNLTTGDQIGERGKEGAMDRGHRQMSAILIDCNHN